MACRHYSYNALTSRKNGTSSWEKPQEEKVNKTQADARKIMQLYFFEPVALYPHFNLLFQASVLCLTSLSI